MATFLDSTLRQAMFRSRFTVATVLLALVLVHDPLSAQDPGAEPATNVTLNGRVIDQVTGAPLHGATVQLRGARNYLVTDAEGRFTLRLRPGSLTLEFDYPGYSAGELTMQLEAGVVSQDFALAPEPLVLEGLRVVGDRFRRRRDASAVSVSAFERASLLTAVGSAQDFVLSRTNLILAPCPGRVGMNSCAWRRGEVQQISVVINEVPVIQGLEQLEMYTPQELYLVEVYRGGQHIRVYTTQYMERAAKQKLHPLPVF